MVFEPKPKTAVLGNTEAKPKPLFLAANWRFFHNVEFAQPCLLQSSNDLLITADSGVRTGDAFAWQ